jgi:glycosyltransferase involved in cell wall biosynthesis
MKKKISVVVLTYNRIESLKLCVQSIKVNSKLVGEIIVVDNGSDDGTKDWLVNNIGLVEPILRTDNSLGVTSRNFGFSEAEYPFVAQVDDDVLVHPNWDENMMSYFEYDLKKPFKIGAVGVQGFKLLPYWLSDWPSQKAVKPGELCDILTGYCWMFSNGNTEPCWQYNWNFAPFWHEELDLQLRMRSHAAYKFRATPMVCSHICKRSVEVNWKLHNRNLEYVRNMWKDNLSYLHLEGCNTNGGINYGDLGSS